MLDTFRSLLRTGRDISICKKQEKYYCIFGFRHCIFITIRILLLTKSAATAIIKNEIGG